QTGKKYVAITVIEPVGNYAIRIGFDDGHDSGIYAWDYLMDLERNKQQYWDAYLAELKTANASRLPTIPVVGQWSPRD
ncbi:MAG: gamma-butyrobetaine hydroxylase-like domain-containing protein, partial [Gammaproteobacteria bacterium]